MSLSTISIFCTLCVLTTGQVPIPNREVGYVYMGGEPGAPVHIDVYIDLICPDSRDTWHTLLTLAEYYRPDTLQLTVHLFPLPYHRSSFSAAKGARIIDKVSHGTLTYHWIQKVFQRMGELTNDEVLDLSDRQLIDKLASIARDVGVSPSAFKSLMNNDDIEQNTRIAWKYGCTRGVAGTPTFMVNDVVVAADPKWSFNQWRNIIDPLLD